PCQPGKRSSLILSSSFAGHQIWARARFRNADARIMAGHMETTPTLRVHLHGHMLASARAGSFPAMAVLADAVRAQGWRVAFAPASDAPDPEPPPGDYALLHMKRPLHPRCLTLRRAYHYPFWNIEPVAERWRFAVARAGLHPETVDPARAAAVAQNLRPRVL